MLTSPRSLLRLVGCAVSLAFLATFAPAQTIVDYHGFRIDGSKLRGFPNLAALIASTQQQVDMVESVGLPESFLVFFHSVPLELVPPGVIAPGNPGLYSQHTRTVQITTVLLAFRHKPVLLHEMIHAGFVA